jgi:hypothetical protein
MVRSSSNSSIAECGWFPRHYAHLAGGYAQLGKPNEAAATTAALLQAMPGFSIKWLLLQEAYKHPADTEHLVECLRKAGLPE